MREHHLRRRVVGEMHLRRWPSIAAPSLILQWVVLVDEGERETELGAISARAMPATTPSPAHMSGTLNGDITFNWEKHSEGSSLTLFAPGRGAEAFLDLASDREVAAAIEWAQSLPGEIVRSTCIWIAEMDRDVNTRLADTHMSRAELVSCHLGERIRMWSDFRLREDGFGRLIVAANGADPTDLTRQVQRLQELGNYRNRALLGLPVARDCWPRLDAAEQRLSDLAARVANNEEADDPLMNELSSLSLDLMAVSTGIGFRMDATAAYAKLVEERLAQIDARPIDGFASLEDFTARRFLPAVDTCAATANRAKELSVRATQLSSLLRARIETRIENQNARLLRSMDRSIGMQVRLQQFVEGLSVVALSYYLLGLVLYALEAAKVEYPAIEPKVIVGILVVPTLALIWIAIRLIKRRVLSGDDSQSS